MLNHQSGFDFEQDVELKAVQNDDFEQQYLSQCLRETKKEYSLVLPQLASRTLSAKSLEAKYLHSPKSPDSNQDENYLASNIQTPKVPVLTKMNANRRKSQTNAESSFMSLFFIGRFVEKISNNRKLLGCFNDAHFNLIGDKASDSQILSIYLLNIDLFIIKIYIKFKFIDNFLLDYFILILNSYQIVKKSNKNKNKIQQYIFL